MQQLKLWSTAFKDQPKIVDAYNMLEKTGNTKIQVSFYPLPLRSAKNFSFNDPSIYVQLYL